MPRITKLSDKPQGTPFPLDLDEAVELLEQRLASGNVDVYRPANSGFPQIDRLTGGGYQAGDLRILGGYQNIGKTARMLQSATAVALDNTLAIVVCYEHPAVHLLERLLCQASRSSISTSDQAITVDGLRRSYVSVIKQLQDNHSDGKCHFDVVLDNVSGVFAWSNLARVLRRIWLVNGDGEYTTPEALAYYVDNGLKLHKRVVLFVDSLQLVPYSESSRSLTAIERIERVIRSLKSMAMRQTNSGNFVSVECIAMADEEGLRKNRVHFEDMWGPTTLQYSPDVALIGNNDRSDADGIRTVRWAIEKNRNGPSGVELRYRYHGAQFSFEHEGQVVDTGESWQSEREALVQERKG